MENNKTIKFFISSTFKDFEAERNILQKFVFPKLKELCHLNGFGFQPIDLRWGIIDEAGLDQQTMNICLNEIKRSSYDPKPNLLLLVGQRYGWVPLPYDIEENELKNIISKVSTSNKELIEQWYIKDENTKDTTYYLKDKYGIKRDEWNKIENQIKDAFQDATNIERYHTSATEQEMYQGLDKFSEEVEHTHTFAYFRTIVNYNQDDKNLVDFIDSDLEKLNKLKGKLQNKTNIPNENHINLTSVEWKNIIESKEISYEDLTLENCPLYLKEFYDQILEQFTISITKEINNFAERTNLQIELEEQSNFLDIKSEVVLGRDDTVNKINNFIEDTNTEQYYLQYGKSGSGKTSVMAKAITDINKAKYMVIYRFIGTTAYSTYSNSLFESIYWEIESIMTNNKQISKPFIEINTEKFKKQFKEQLEKLEDKQVVIFLDAVDQFEDYNDLTILLDDLPSNIKVIFSTLYDKTKSNEDYYKYFNLLSFIDNKYELPALNDNDNLKILKQWLLIKNRTITEEQSLYIQQITSNKTPLYLKLVFEIVKHWKHDKVDIELKDSEEDLIIQFFNLIQKQYHHKDILLKEALGYISASKNGLSEEEILDLFSRDDEFLKQFQNHRYPNIDRLPTSIWSRFYYYMQEFFTEKLIDGEMLILPYHRIINETIKKEYYEKDKISLHTKLSNYFLTLQDKSKTWDKKYNNLHMLDELPYHLFHSNNSEQLKEILFDLEFAGTIYNNHKQDGFKNIISKASQLGGITEDEIYPWESFYREKEHLISKVDEELWRPYQSLFQLAYEDGVYSSLTEKAELLLDNNKISWSWLKRKWKNKEYTRIGLDKILIGHNDIINSVIELQNGNLVSCSNDKTIRIWNKEIIKPIILKGHKKKVIDIIELNCGDILSWSKDNTIRIWDKETYNLKYIEQCSKNIKSVKVLSNGKILILVKNKSFKIWDIYSNKSHIIKKHNKLKIDIDKQKDNNIGIIELSNGEIISWNNTNSTVQLWNQNTENIKVYDGMYYQNIIELNSGEILIWNSITIEVIDKDSGIINLEIDTDSLISNINSLGVIELNNGNILSWTENKTIIIWDREGCKSKVFKGHQKSICEVIELSNKDILSWSKDKTIRILDKESGKTKVIKAHSADIIGVNELKNGEILSWSSSEIIITNKETSISKFFEGHNDIIIGVIELSNSHILSYSNDQTIRVWNTKYGNTKRINKFNIDYGMNAIELKDKSILSWSNKSIEIFNYYNGKSIIFNKHINLIIGKITGAKQLQNNKILFWTTSGMYLLLNKDNGKIFIPRSGTIFTKIKSIILLWIGSKIFPFVDNLMNNIDGLSNIMSELKVLNDGRILTLADLTNLRIFDQNFKKSKVIKIIDSIVTKTIILSSGEIVYWANQDDIGDNIRDRVLKDLKKVNNKTIKILNEKSMKTNILQGHTKKVNNIIELDSGEILSWSEDKTIRIWNKESGDSKTLKGHNNYITNVIELDNGEILSWAEDETMRIWDNDGNILSLIIYPLSDYKINLKNFSKSFLIYSDILLSQYSLQLQTKR